MSEIYNVKKILKKIIVNFISTEIEWVPLNSVEVNKENKENIVDFLETLEEDDDVQNVYSNVNLMIFNDDYWNIDPGISGSICFFKMV